ncbi:MAG: FAD-dependent oxidoreductase [Myxococcota bacterium]
MIHTHTLIVGAGVTGLACADRLGDADYLIVEAEPEIGGYCRTVKRDGFTWDYSGHFFHFRDPEIEADLVSRMTGRVLRVERASRIWYANSLIDFPFQRHLHQLPPDEYEQCVRDLEARDESRSIGNFKDMLYARYGRGIAEKFLIPYNEKLYATNVATLDVDAMGRFFPHATTAEMLSREPTKGSGYNTTFTYPEGGAVQYVEALSENVSPDRVFCRERVVGIDLGAKVATTNRRSISYDRLVSTMPLVSLLEICALPHDPSVFDWNRVLVFNLGFDRKGLSGVHWVYYPQRSLSFYRVGYYDNILGDDRMSLYVEIGLGRETESEPGLAERWLPRVLSDLQACGVLKDQALIASHHALLDPAYVHITTQSTEQAALFKSMLAEESVYSIGRYGSWRYCSIEDNIVEARALVAERLA